MAHTDDATLETLRAEHSSLQQRLASLEQEYAQLRQRVDWLETLFERAPIGLVVGALDGYLIETNPAMQSILGYTAEELRGIQVASLSAYGEDRIDQAIFMELLTGQRDGYMLDTCCLHKDGHSIWVRIGYSLSFDANNQPVAVIGSIEDISIPKRIEGELRKFQCAVEQSPLSIVITDLNAQIEYVNPQFTQITGYTFEEVCGQNPRILQSGETPPDIYLQMWQTLTAGKSWSGEFQNRKKDGTLYWEQASIAPITDAAGTITHYVAMKQDITERKQIEQSLRGAYADLEQRVQNRTQSLTLLNQQLRAEIDQREQIEVALRQSESRYREITELTSDLIYSVVFDTDPYGAPHLEWELNSTEKLTGYAVGEIGAGGWELKVVHPDDMSLAIHDLNQLYIGQTIESEYRIITKDGTIRWVHEYAHPVLDEQNRRLVRIYGAIKDITRQKLTSKALRESEERLRTLFAILPDTIFHIDPDGFFVDFKASSKEPLLMPPNEFLLRSFRDVLPPTLAQQLHDAIESARQHGEVERFEYEIILPDGLLYDYEARVIIGADNHVFCIVRNISDAKQAEAAIRQYAARAEALVRVAARLNAQLDLETILDALCIEMRQALGVDMAGMCLFDPQQDAMVLVHAVDMPADLIAAMAPLPRAMIDLTTLVKVFPDFQQQCPFLSMQVAAQFDVQSMIQAVVMRGDDMVGLLIGFTIGQKRTFSEDEHSLLQGIADQGAQAIINARLFDTVEQERALLSQRVAERTADLSRTNAELERALRSRDEFLANMSHELRTPLNSILGISEALQAGVYGPTNQRQMQWLGMIDQSGQHLLMLINDILDLAKIESGKVDLQLDPIELEALCHSCLQFIKQQATNRKIAVSLQLDPALASLCQDSQNPFASRERPSILLFADKRRLKQILINLLTNAVKFTPEGGKVSLEVRADADQPVIHFSVRDTGIGIAPGDQSRLFQPFTQLDSRLARLYEGSGLGLALVARLTELHGGTVSLTSELGKGSCFTVSLPLAHPGVADEHLFYQEVEPDVKSIKAEQTSSDGVPQPLILLAEDNHLSGNIIIDYLDSYRYQIIRVYNGIDAIRSAKEFEPALILMDIHMPELDGLAAIRQIRNDPRLAMTPIIALTALAMKGDEDRCLEAGATDYLSKPVPLWSLLQMIEQYLDEK